MFVRLDITARPTLFFKRNTTLLRRLDTKRRPRTAFWRLSDQLWGKIRNVGFLQVFSLQQYNRLHMCRHYDGNTSFLPCR